MEAPARLHLGFLDLNGGLGRRFGSLGLTIDAFATRLTAQLADDAAPRGQGRGARWPVPGPMPRRADCAAGCASGSSEEIPGHAGLGSGTQMALAVGTALERLLGSGAAGGVDAAGTAAPSPGHWGAASARASVSVPSTRAVSSSTAGAATCPGVPPVVMRLPFPADWRVLLVLDRRGQGLHGDREARAFAALPAFPEATAGHLCRLLLMQLVPGLIEGRLAAGR